MTQYAGIDLGSRSIELVVINEQKNIVQSLITDTGFDPITNAKTLLAQAKYDYITATGYGRNLFEIEFETNTVTEIKAHAYGAITSFPSASTVLDIGGQDSKVIALSSQGKVLKFEMNDRCAAGTGKFMEVMAKSLGYSIESFGQEAMSAENEISITSMCTVFAESEVTSLIAKGVSPQEIALGLHASVIRRVSSMLGRVSSDGDIVFTGGVANNPCMVSLLKKTTHRNVYVPPMPQSMGALGAALLTHQRLQ